MKNIKKTLRNLSVAGTSYYILTGETLARFWLWTEVRPPDGVPDWEFSALFIKILSYFLWFLWLLALVMIIYAGVQIVVWEEEDVKKARTSIIYAVVGLVVVILSYSIVNIIIRVPGA